MTTTRIAHDDITSYIMDSLSDELHCIIVTYLTEQHMGAANYRLINKRCAKIGAQYLFDHFMCKPSTQCVERLRYIQQAKLNHHIKTVDWTSDLDSPHDEDEINLDSHVNLFRDIVLASPNVTTLGALQLPYDTFFNKNYNLEFAQACNSLTYLDLKFFASKADFDAWMYDDQKRTEFLRNLSEVLAHTRHLTVLELCFGPDKYWRNDHVFAKHGLKHIIPTNKIWPKLRHLELRCVSIMEQDIVQFLAAHSKTLTCVYLRGIFLLDPNQNTSEEFSTDRTRMKGWKKSAWRRIFAQFKAMEKMMKIVVEEIAYDPGPDDERKMILRSRDGREIGVETNLKKILEGEV